MNNKIKFQNPNFRNKLKDAREYKRSYKKIPETKLGIFLARVGLSSLVAKIIAALALLGLVYLIYVPNFLTIKHIEIQGPSSEAQARIEVSVRNYLKFKPWWPQRNLSLLSKKDLTTYLTDKDESVVSVKTIEKDFPNKLVIQIGERLDKFLLENSGKRFLVSNDGKITKRLNEALGLATSTPYAHLLPLVLKEDKTLLEKDNLADLEYFAALWEVIGLQAQLNNPVIKITIESLERRDIEVLTERGFVVKYDLTFDINKVFGQLKLLLEEVGTARIIGVKYIDMRIKDRGYVCYKDAPCASESVPVQATTTVETLNN